jgi:hypothetical protein
VPQLHVRSYAGPALRKHRNLATRILRVERSSISLTVTQTGPYQGYSNREDRNVEASR